MFFSPNYSHFFNLRLFTLKQSIILVFSLLSICTSACWHILSTSFIYKYIRDMVVHVHHLWSCLSANSANLTLSSSVDFAQNILFSPPSLSFFCSFFTIKVGCNFEASYGPLSFQQLVNCIIFFNIECFCIFNFTMCCWCFLHSCKTITFLVISMRSNDMHW